MYKVFASMRTDMNEGWVWVSDLKLPARSIIEIHNKTSKKSVYCELLEIDDNFLNEYNRPPRIPITSDNPSVVINGWYRKKLGDIQTQQNCDLTIIESTCVCGLWGRLRACTGHPQIVVRLATWLGLASVVLGCLSVLVAFR